MKPIVNEWKNTILETAPVTESVVQVDDKFVSNEKLG